VAARGRAAELEARLNGSGDLELDDVEAERALVELDGSGDVDVRASRLLDLRLDGSGDITYAGDGEVREQLDGSGDISRG
ncbi:MAG TPA: DUF2807 domain-containing protein, partial [Capillimicrobium sp.]